MSHVGLDIQYKQHWTISQRKHYLMLQTLLVLLYSQSNMTFYLNFDGAYSITKSMFYTVVFLNK